MNFNKRPWFWNVLLVLTVILCISVLTLHFKNWINNDSNSLSLMSGFYKVDIRYQELDSAIFVQRMPPMERLNGFSALEKEKGIFREFKDSLTDKKVHVFVDNINQQKLKLVYKDSLHLYVNLKDSTQTVELLNGIVAKMISDEEPN